MILRRRRKRDSFLPLIQLLTDGIAIYVILSAVFWVRFASGFFEETLGEEHWPVYFNAFHLTALITLFFLRANQLYRPGAILSFGDEATRILKALVSTVLVLTAATFFIRDFSFSRSFLITAGVFLAGGLVLERFLLGRTVLAIDQRRGSLQNVLILGCEDAGGRLARYYQNNPRSARKVVGFLDAQALPRTHYEGFSVLGSVDQFSTILKTQRNIHEVVLAIPEASTDLVLRLISDCEKEMVNFRRVADMVGLITARMSVSYAGGVSVLSFTDSPLTDWENRVLKRVTDLVLSFFALVVLSPLLFGIGVAVRLGSRGPIFYRQERIGEDGRHFMLLKFRTMKVDAEKESGPVWAKENDPRRTASGSFLRQNNLDELPQLWNVFVGDMSLVGPRPERPHFVSQFKEDIPRYMARHAIRSGITGWAQVNGLRGNTSIEERTKFDLYYIENWSLWLDIKILFMTLFARKNAY